MPGILIALLALLVLFGLWSTSHWLDPGRIGQKLAERVPGRTRRDGVALRTWAETALESHPALQTWLLGLPETGLVALIERLEAFCLDLNLQPRWLWNPETLPTPHLRDVVTGVVTEYLEACHQAMIHQDQLTLCGLYLEWVENVTDARHHELRRHLFSLLVEADLAEPMPSYDLIVASETQRQEWAAQAIRTAALKDWPQFVTLANRVRIDTA